MTSDQTTTRTPSLSVFKALWPDLDVDDRGLELLNAIVVGHRDAALNNQNCSSVAYACAVAGGATLQSKFVAAISTTGRLHAPVHEARLILFESAQWREMIKVGLRVPGFGNSFFKDKIDPAFQPAFDLLSIPTQNHLQQIAMAIGTAKGVSIFPNAASITAAVAWELGLPLGGEFLLFLLGRGASWITMG